MSQSHAAQAVESLSPTTAGTDKASEAADTDILEPSDLGELDDHLYSQRGRHIIPRCLDQSFGTLNILGLLDGSGLSSLFKRMQPFATAVVILEQPVIMRIRVLSVEDILTGKLH